MNFKCFCLSNFIYLAAFFGDAAFFVVDFGFDAFFAAAGFLAAVDLGFLVVVAFLTDGLAAFFVAVFFTPAGLAALVFFALVCFGFFVPDADFVFELDRGFVVLAILTFFGLVAAVVVDDADVVVVAADVDAVAELFVLAAVATFFADFVPADFERARFFCS